ncbi:hypothetical protein [Roseateles sp. LKC17W]|uniref:AlpA family phage regulatory protein n=1 Tax=Pelomonas margarita TaxID=3299031 RepID=A0ABW7FLH7_9BURK
MSQERVAEQAAFADELRGELESLHGPLLGGQKLIAALGLASAASLRQARRRGRVSVPLFTLPKRRGFFALTRDVAVWLAQARLAATHSTAQTQREEPNT